VAQLQNYVLEKLVKENVLTNTSRF